MLALAIGLCGCAVSSKPTAGREKFQDVTGRAPDPVSLAGARALTLIFTTTDCPIANSYAPELTSIMNAYGPRGVRFCLVHVDPATTSAKARQHAIDFGYPCPVVLDPRHVLVSQQHATVTPEAAVLDATGTQVYLGRIDDRHIDFGKKRFEPTTRDLRDALDAVLAGNVVTQPRTRAVGCYIPGVEAGG